MTDDPTDDRDPDFVADDTERTPRLLAEDLITRAFQLSCLNRAFTDDELEEITLCLAFALVQLKKLPGGPDAIRQANARARAELARRGKQPSPTMREAFAEALDHWEDFAIERNSRWHQDRIAEFRQHFDIPVAAAASTGAAASTSAVAPPDPSFMDAPAGIDAEGASSFLGKTVVPVQLGTGDHAIMRTQGFRNDSPIYWCPQCGKLWRSDQCPVHPGPALQILGFDDKAGP